MKYSRTVRSGNGISWKISQPLWVAKGYAPTEKRTLDYYTAIPKGACVFCGRVRPCSEPDHEKANKLTS